jgi:hypothetical protein
MHKEVHYQEGYKNGYIDGYRQKEIEFNNKDKQIKL